MRITPRKEEIAAIAAVLDAGHDSMEAGAKAVLKRAAEILAMRDSYAFVPEGMGVALGPYGSEIEAAKQAGRITESYRVVRLSAPGRLEGNLDGAEWVGYCECRCAKFMHRAEGSGYGKCATLKCKCVKWQERKA